MTFPKAGFSSSTDTFASLCTLLDRHRKLVRIALYLYVVLIVCPIRYQETLGSELDQTWIFALNYAAAHGLAVGRDVLFTYGPLGYLSFPLPIGNNLAQALLFQTGLWLLLAMVFADVFFRAGFPLRNLALFSFCFGLAAPLFYFGTEYLILAGTLLLVLMFHLRGSLTRYLAALVLVGLLPLFKLSAGLIGFTALTGLLVEWAVRRGWKALLEASLTAIVPAAVTVGVCLFVMPSAHLLNYLRGSVDLTRGYSAAMSSSGPAIELVSALEAVTVLVVLLWLQLGASPTTARLYALFLAIPLLISFKHGFVRQDGHIINFFCFVALALALVSLTIHLNGRTGHRVAFLMILFFIIWQDTVGRLSSFSGESGPTLPTGVQAVHALLGARLDRIKQSMDDSMAAFPENLRIEPELIQLIGDSPVASLSVTYTNLAVAGLRLRLYPVVQRYAAFTPYLDGLNAAWIRDKGPRFLVFDGTSIDGRDPWAETPAMWLEVYRWYDARLLGARNLLFERRSIPRFTALETIGHYRIAFPGGLRLPVSHDPVFWTMNCGQSIQGRFRRLMYRIPRVSVRVYETGGVTRSGRIIPEVLVSPLLGNYWPGNMSQFAAVFNPDVNPAYSIDQIQFLGNGTGSYSSSCEVEILRPKS